MQFPLKENSNKFIELHVDKEWQIILLKYKAF